MVNIPSGYDIHSSPWKIHPFLRTVNHLFRLGPSIPWLWMFWDDMRFSAVFEHELSPKNWKMVMENGDGKWTICWIIISVSPKNWKMNGTWWYCKPMDVGVSIVRHDKTTFWNPRLQCLICLKHARTHFHVLDFGLFPSFSDHLPSLGSIPLRNRCFYGCWLYYMINYGDKQDMRWYLIYCNILWL